MADADTSGDRGDRRRVSPTEETGLDEPTLRRVRSLLRRVRLVNVVVVLVFAGLVVTVTVVAADEPATVVAVGFGAYLPFALPLLYARDDLVLRIDRSPDAVREAFLGPRPPPLVFLWAGADDLRTVDGGAEVDVSSSLGLRSATLRVESAPVAGGVEIAVTRDGEVWRSYDVDVRERETGTETEVAVRARTYSRISVLRAIQAGVRGRYVRAALAELGYEAVTVEGSVSLRAP